MDKKSESFPTNPEKLPWPQDIGGITARLRREGCRSIGRMNGNDNHYAVVMDVLRVLAKHAKAKLVAQKKRNSDRVTVSERTRLDNVMQRDGDRVLKMRNIAKDMEHMKQQYAQLEAQGVSPAPVHTVKNITASEEPKIPVVPTPPKQPASHGLAVKERKLQSEQAKAAGLGLPKAS